jgi:hypothetical protein
MGQVSGYACNFILFIVEFIRYIIMWGFVFFHDAPEAVVRGAGLFWVVMLCVPQIGIPILQLFCASTIGLPLLHQRVEIFS